MYLNQIKCFSSPHVFPYKFWVAKVYDTQHHICKYWSAQLLTSYHILTSTTNHRQWWASRSKVMPFWPFGQPTFCRPIDAISFPASHHIKESSLIYGSHASLAIYSTIVYIEGLGVLQFSISQFARSHNTHHNY